MLVSIITHGGDDDGRLTRRFLLVGEINVDQVLQRVWGLHHLCYRHGRRKRLRVFLGFGLSPVSRVTIDGVIRTVKGVAEKFLPDIAPNVEKSSKERMCLGICVGDHAVRRYFRC